MNHMKNIKEMLNISTGSRNVATSGYSSFTDSQLFFGSQFWPENSQGTSQDMSLSSRTSQQSSQEGSEPKFSNSYHTKPLLFGELKDKTRDFGLLDKFEEDRKKDKEKNDSDLLAKECQHIRETLSNIQKLVTGTERNMAVCQTILEKFDNFASALQNNLNGLQNDISQQFESLVNKMNSHKEVMTELEGRVKKSGDTTEEFGSNLQSLKSSLESQREEQEREQKMIEEVLKLLSTLASEHLVQPSPQRLMDSAIQTSPGLEKSLSSVLPRSSSGGAEGKPLTVTSHELEHKQVGGPPEDPGCGAGRRRFTLRGHRRRKKRPLVLSQRSRCAVPDENARPPERRSKTQRASGPLCERRGPNTAAGPDGRNPLSREKRSSKAAGCVITPLSCWSEDSSSSACLAEFETIVEKLSAESKTGTPAKRTGLWQLFDVDCDSEEGF